MATFVGHEPCPSCGSRDNLGRYDDGSAYCFGCHFYVHKSRIPLAALRNEIKDKEDVHLPTDLCNDFPRYVVEWLARYDVSVAEALKHGWKYSPYYDQLIFIFKDQEGKTFYQARNFRSGSRSKYFNVGEKEGVLPIFKAHMGIRTVDGRVVITEDVVSAARIARQNDAMPCLGSSLPVKKIIALKRLYSSLLVWLDSDKYREAREIADQAKWLGMSAKALYTKLDPKEYSDVEIKKFLEG